ncbi:tyrosine-type recombinase/integrase [Lysobacter sp. 2RAF19]
MPVVRRQVLTKLLVDGIKPKSSSFRVWDAKVPGLALRVRPTGRKAYELHWGRNKAVVLGTHGAMTLEGARSAALRALGETEEHGAPLATVEGGLGKASTFGEFVTRRYGPHLLAVNKAGAETLAAINAQFGFLVDRPLAGVTRADFDDFKAKRLSAGTHPSTVNRDMDRLKAALSQAVEWGLLAENPLRGVKRIKRGIEERVRYLTTKEEAALRKALDARERRFQARRVSGAKWRAERGKPALKAAPGGYSDHLMPMTLLALNTGMRRGELTSLNREDINLSAKVLTVRATSAKSGRARHLPLNSEALAGPVTMTLTSTSMSRLRTGYPTGPRSPTREGRNGVSKPGAGRLVSSAAHQ